MSPNFFDATTVNLVAIAADIYALYIAVVVAFALPVHWRFLNFPPTAIYNRPPRILGRFQVPPMKPTTIVAFQVVFVSALVCAVIADGLLHKLSLITALVAYFPVFSAVAGLETNARKTYLIPLFLVVFIAAPNSGGNWHSESVYWPIWALKLLICQIYVSAAFQKLRNHGVGWFSQSSLGVYLLRLDLYEDNPWARKLNSRPHIYKPISFATLCFQATFWIVLVIPITTPAYLIFGAAFHIGIFVLMRINYLKYLSGAYLILLLDSLYILLPNRHFYVLLGL